MRSPVLVDISRDDSVLLRYNHMPSTSMACPDDLEQRAPEVSIKKTWLFAFGSLKPDADDGLVFVTLQGLEGRQTFN